MALGTLRSDLQAFATLSFAQEVKLVSLHASAVRGTRGHFFRTMEWERSGANLVLGI